MREKIVLLDMVSHSEMHLPFNEGYLKAVALAFPEKEIIFAACQGHLDNLKSQVGDIVNVSYRAIPQFDELLNGKSYHHPFYGRKAAKFYTHWLETQFDLKEVLLVTILGARAAMIQVMKRFWKRQPGTCHYLQHNQLDITMKWRSRNPLERYFDYLSVLKRGLPHNQKLIVLELGLDETLISLAPALQNSVAVIEHPVLESEWLPSTSPSESQPLKVAFLGHCGRGKGFDVFCELAKEFNSSKLQFMAIGKENTSQAEDFDMSGLTLKPNKGHLARETFVSLLGSVDLVCLPLPSTVSYVSSGSIIDAFAAAKPLITTSNQSHRAIEKKYGTFGVLAESNKGLFEFFAHLQSDQHAALENYEQWKANTLAIRKQRGERSLASRFRELVPSFDKVS